LQAMMSPVMQQLGDITLIDGMGHWIQQEAPAETNAAIIQFLKSI
jgi:pimeloyl-ACP methyl ester carboxylesterase